MSLPRSGVTDEEIARWVRDQMARMDLTPQNPSWRWRAVGMNYGEAIAQAPPTRRLYVRLPVAEMRVIRDVARERGLPLETMIRRALATWLVAVGVPPESIPTMTKEGLIR